VYIMQLVLSRTTARWSKSWSEAQFEMVIYYTELKFGHYQVALSLK